ncbi:MAG: trehalase family glycosidase, partial [bacterium]|nr:trehalase family glycosidase [bacterium]
DSADTYFGGFPGPFRFTEGRWLSRSLVQFKLLNADDLSEIDLKTARKKKIVFYPGRLHQYFQTEKLELQLDLWYLTGNTALIRAAIKNISTDVISVIPQWQGSTFANDLQFTLEHDRLRLDLTDQERFYLHPISRSSITTDYELESNSYRIRKIPINLPLNLPLFNYFVVTHIVEGKELFSEIDNIREMLRQPNQAFQQNVHRWNHFLHQIFQATSLKDQRSNYRYVAVKSLLTLVNNWRKPYRGLRHGGLFPSSAAPYFFGFWAWDSWKHAVALTQFAPEIAKDQIRAMFDYQDESGMVADCIFADAAANNWRNTKPPLAAWAVFNVYEADRDTAFLKEMFPRLKRYHAWWYQHRDHDGNGLCEYGSTDGSIEAAAWESGMDNAARFDAAIMLKNHPGAYSMDQESVDLNSFLFAEKKYLAKIAAVLQKNDEAGELLREAEELQIKIQKMMYDESTGYFYDIKLQTKEPILIQGPEGWIPLWAGVASAEQAETARGILIDPSKFATFVPFPTLARDAP